MRTRPVREDAADLLAVLESRIMLGVGRYGKFGRLRVVRGVGYVLMPEESK